MVSYIDVYKAVQLKSRLQHTGTRSAAVCVIAQQYSSATFVSLRFRFRKEKFGARFKDFIIAISYFFNKNSVNLKPRYL
jgi:hypothetical protein